VAAGDGTRFGGRKQFTKIEDREMVDWALCAAREVADGIVLVLPPGDTRLACDEVKGADVVVAGGETRSASVRAGLDVVPQHAAVIVVHDGTRPLATRALFTKVIDAIKEGADAAVPALASADTLKRVRDGIVVGSVDRDEVMAVQTPQAFRAEVLRRAHSRGDDATDDAGLVEALGVTVSIVPGDARNIKVTTPADLELVRALAARDG